MNRVSRLVVAPALLGLVAALTVLFLLHSGASAQAVPPLDHFKCYATQGQSVGEIVDLRDQFADDPKAQVRATRLFCNPVEKTHADVVTPILNPDHHLKLYRIGARPVPDRQVVVSNQFDPLGGPQVLNVTRPIFLAVPTQKDPHPKPDGLDHFKCYLASGPSVDAIVNLSDQFIPDDRVKVRRPLAFCNPVEKTHADVVTPILNPDDHLVCYRMAVRDPFMGTVVVHDQFIDEDLILDRPNILCVPSIKLSFGPSGCDAPGVVDICVDGDGIATSGPGAFTIAVGDPILSAAAGGNPAGLDLIDRGVINGMYEAGDDLMVEDPIGTPTCPSALRDAIYNNVAAGPQDCVVLDPDGSLVDGDFVTCDTGAGCGLWFRDDDGDGRYDEGEDLVVDVNGSGFFD